MISHVVLFRPKPSLSDSQRQSLLAAITTAARSIPSVVRFTVGRSLTGARDYGLPGSVELPYFAHVELVDRAGLIEYLQHPAHQELGRLFRESLDAALVIDYETTDAAALDDVLIDECRIDC